MDQKQIQDAPGTQVLRTPLLERRRAFEGGYLKVDVLEFEGRPPAVREVVAVNPGVCVLGVDREGKVAVVRQFRQAIDRVIFELPAGVRDDGEAAIDAARRELSEEAGLAGGTWTHLLHYAHAEGYSDGWMDLFLAMDCDREESHPDPGEELELLEVPVREFYAMVDRGDFVDAKTILAAAGARRILAQRWEA